MTKRREEKQKEKPYRNGETILTAYITHQWLYVMYATIATGFRIRGDSTPGGSLRLNAIGLLVETSLTT